MPTENFSSDAFVESPGRDFTQSPGKERVESGIPLTYHLVPYGGYQVSSQRHGWNRMKTVTASGHWNSLLGSFNVLEAVPGKKPDIFLKRTITFTLRHDDYGERQKLWVNKLNRWTGGLDEDSFVESGDAVPGSPFSGTITRNEVTSNGERAELEFYYSDTGATGLMVVQLEIPYTYADLTGDLFALVDYAEAQGVLESPGFLSKQYRHNSGGAPEEGVAPSWSHSLQRWPEGNAGGYVAGEIGSDLIHSWIKYEAVRWALRTTFLNPTDVKFSMRVRHTHYGEDPYVWSGSNATPEVLLPYRLEPLNDGQIVVFRPATEQYNATTLLDYRRWIPDLP